MEKEKQKVTYTSVASIDREKVRIMREFLSHVGTLSLSLPVTKRSHHQIYQHPNINKKTPTPAGGAAQGQLPLGSAKRIHMTDQL